MSEVQYDNSGMAWKNDKMREGKQDPQYTGSVTVAGAEYWISMWVNKATETKKASFGIKFKAKEPVRREEREPDVDEDPDSILPF